MTRWSSSQAWKWPKIRGRNRDQTGESALRTAVPLQGAGGGRNRGRHHRFLCTLPLLELLFTVMFRPVGVADWPMRSTSCLCWA